ncbi:MAG: phosphatase PAP2 family protein [Planctomycetales bacterium]|nr:phosphatase PAP2 family protein [Planctomycetales bacterium]
MASPAGSPPAPPPHQARWGLRLLLVLAGIALWYQTQSWIAQRPLLDHRIRDLPLEWLAPVNGYFQHHPLAADALLIVSSLVIDALGLFLLGWAICGPSLRPFLGLVILFSLRQICQVFCALPAPPEMIWHQPHLPPQLGGYAVPSLLVTYDVANDFFFSGHTALATYGALEVARLGRRWIPLAGGIVLFETATVLVLHAHWTMDVFAAVVAAITAACLASWLAPLVDQRLKIAVP